MKITLKYLYKNIKNTILIWSLLLIPAVSAIAADNNNQSSSYPDWLESLKNANFGQILINIQKDIPALVNFVVAASYVLGVSFIFSAVHELKIYGQPRMMMPAMASITGPLGKMAIGAFLIFLPGTLDTLLYTLWGTTDVMLSWDSTPLSQSSTSLSIPLEILNAAVALVRLFGYIAIVHGFVLLSKVTKQGAPPGQFGKGVIQVIGGVLAVNIIETINIIWGTLFGL